MKFYIFLMALIMVSGSVYGMNPPGVHTPPRVHSAPKAHTPPSVHRPPSAQPQQTVHRPQNVVPPSPQITARIQQVNSNLPQSYVAPQTPRGVKVINGWTNRFDSRKMSRASLGI